MEADWEIELGQDAPVIDACWPGLVDLRNSPERVIELAEVQRFPALAGALLRLNAPTSTVWTAKCDVWTAESFDRYELDAPPELAITAKACYVDLLPRRLDQWSTPHQAEDACRKLCTTLQAIPLRCCRVDLIVRMAILTPAVHGLGVTAYVTACGSSEAEVMSTLADGLIALTDAVASSTTAPAKGS
jgi:hypothetical protein